jgi:hypothetical protein
MACRLDYAISCDTAWRTAKVAVSGWVGDDAIDTGIQVVDDGMWLQDGVECPGVRGCIDVDLNFSPVTNLLPIRRCKPQVGEVVAVRAAWLRFPSFALEPLDQSYGRRSASTYEYTSGGGAFRTDVTVDDFGLAVEYRGGWVRE